MYIIRYKIPGGLEAREGSNDCEIATDGRVDPPPGKSASSSSSLLLRSRYHALLPFVVNLHLIHPMLYELLQQ